MSRLGSRKWVMGGAARAAVLVAALMAIGFASGMPEEEVAVEEVAHPPLSAKKTVVAGFVDKVLDKEFLSNAEKDPGISGRSFNDTLQDFNGTLETVARVSSGKQRDENVLNSTNSSLGQFLRRLEEKLQPGSLWAGGGGGDGHGEAVERLIDKNDNEFVMSNPKGGSMELQHDQVFLSDIMGMLIGAATGGIIFGLMGQPVITGYLLAGMCIGPGGLALVNGLVQVETLSQVGVMLLLFSLGMEFSIAKLRNVRWVAMGGGSLQIVLFMGLGGGIATSAGAPLREGVFVGAFLSMSSTTVVLKCLMDRSATHTLYGQLTLGTLILQDIAIGLLFALLPVLAGTSGWMEGSISVIRELVVMGAFVLLSMAASRMLMPRFMRVLMHLGGKTQELHMLGAVALCFLVSQCSDRLGLSTELGAFVAGILVSSSSATGESAERTLHHLAPVRDLFIAFFMVTVGMIMNPTFLYLHLHALVAAVAFVILFKSILIAVVVRCFGYSPLLALSTGISLAQIGEFAFVLLSRASALGLVQRNWYLLLLGTTAVSLVTTPLLFRVLPAILRLAVVMRWIPRDGDMDLFPAVRTVSVGLTVSSGSGTRQQV